MTLLSNTNLHTDNFQIRVYIGGNFDIPHSGHIELFKYAKSIPHSYVIVSLNTDEFSEGYKRKPIMPLSERIAVISAIKYVDEVVINIGGFDSKPAILASKADVILHGSDWMEDSLKTQMGLTDEWLKDHGIKMIYKPYKQGISTTDLINKLR